MKKIIYLIPLFILVLTSCNDWLNVKALGEVEEENMFDNERGFQQTLTGSYTILLNRYAYGRELTVGFTDEIVRYWNKRSEFYEFNYKDPDVVAKLDSTWLYLYRSIANTNLLLDNLNDGKRNEYETFDLIKGEALGLRAYLHLDLLRLYGPVLKDGLNQKAIPYREEFSNNIVKLMTAEEVLKKIETDLLLAYDYLKDDPIKIYGRKAKETVGSNGVSYDYRGIRMNYYAVCGTLARLYQLWGDNSKALNYANEIIDSEIFTLQSKEEFTNNKDLMFQTELIWSLYDEKIEEHISNPLAQGGYTVDINYRDYLYVQTPSDGKQDDYRYTNWWRYVQMSPAYYVLNKYARSYDDFDRDNTYWDKLIPMIRLSEMYYIAAEANLGINNSETYKLLNDVRKARNLDDIDAQYKTNEAVLRSHITYEYMKEFWGEGKLFYFYKRLFHNIITMNGVEITASKDIFELPLPQDEIEFGEN